MCESVRISLKKWEVGDMIVELCEKKLQLGQQCNKDKKRKKKKDAERRTLHYFIKLRFLYKGSEGHLSCPACEGVSLGGCVQFEVW